MNKWSGRQNNQSRPIKTADRKTKVKTKATYEIYVINNINYAGLCIIEVPEGEERKKWDWKSLQSIMGIKSPNLKKEIDIQVQEAQRAQIRWIHSDPCQDIIKITKGKDKERIVKAGRENKDSVLREPSQVYQLSFLSFAGHKK